jgi:hypothetical protein
MLEQLTTTDVLVERINFSFQPPIATVTGLSHVAPIVTIRAQRRKAEKLAAPRGYDPLFPSVLNWAFLRAQLRQSGNGFSHANGHPAPNGKLNKLLAHPRLCLFNLVVALEWTPDLSFLRDLRSAFDATATLLFDVTDGYMTIGQVVVGGMELMDVADIQIMASTRLFPRSSVFGMHEPQKYQPIRLGRGLWNKREGQSISWSAGYGTLVHELCHYALGLKDRYLEPDTKGTMVLPQINLPLDTIMANMTETELEGHRGRAVHLHDKPTVSEWAQLSSRPEFKFLQIQANHEPQAEPPPIQPRPAFRVLGDYAMPAVRMPIPTHLIRPNHCWAFVIRALDSEQPRLIAQGTLDLEAQREGFELLGATLGDNVLLIGKNPAGQPCVLSGKLCDAINNVAQISWQIATPPVAWPLVQVTAGAIRGELMVNVLGGGSPDVTLFPIGQVGPANLDPNGCYRVKSYDGHVLLRWGTGPDQRFLVVHYSEGGSPASGFPVHPNPIPAGSADGNAMLFFYDNGNQAGASVDYSAFRIVTTTHYDNQLPEDSLPRSYTFTITSTQSFAKIAHLKPTMILYFDSEDTPGLSMVRFAGHDVRGLAAWHLIEERCVRPNSFVAISLNPTTAPGLFADQPQSETFRLVDRTFL